MASIHTLVPGQCYQVIREFVDYDYRLHPVGESWVFGRTSFLPYEDGLTLHVNTQSHTGAYRLRWVPEEQAAIIENFTDFVAPCEG